jgi:hypothetical protein
MVSYQSDAGNVLASEGLIGVDIMQISTIFKSGNQIQHLLADHADALIAGTLDLRRLRRQYNRVIFGQAESLLALAEQISESMPVVVPSEEFVEQLRCQLIEGSPIHRSLWKRIRELPPRTQLAAGIGGATLTAGVVLFARRPVVDAALNYLRNRHILAA